MRRPPLSRKGMAIFATVTIVAAIALGLGLGLGLRDDNEDDTDSKDRRDVCSGHGLVYPDTAPSCTCFQCYEGEKCETKSQSCVLTVTVGQPYLAQVWWEQNRPTEDATVRIPPYYGEGYPDPSIPGLVEIIKELHTKVGNADLTSKEVLIGSGATQTINALLSAMAKQTFNQTGRPLTLFARTPYYPGYKDWAQVIPNLVFNTSVNIDTTTTPVVEIVNTPSNPEGVQVTPTYPNAKYHIYDLVYYWPHITNANITPRNNSFMVFSLSKLSGHAGARIGWALVDSSQNDILTAALNYIDQSTAGVCVDAMYKARQILRDIVSHNTKYFGFLKDKMTERWATITELFANQGTVPRFFLESTPGSFYLWVRCANTTLEGFSDCQEVFFSRGVIGNHGQAYGVGPEYMRMNFGDRDDVIDLLLEALQPVLAVP